jgi:hypothetical protein
MRKAGSVRETDKQLYLQFGTPFEAGMIRIEGEADRFRFFGREAVHVSGLESDVDLLLQAVHHDEPGGGRPTWRTLNTYFVLQDHRWRHGRPSCQSVEELFCEDGLLTEAL